MVDPRPQPAYYDDLDLTLGEVWALLIRGVHDRRAAAHTPVVATVDAQGRPRQRTVVLRNCRPEARRLSFHTDRRSAKWEEIAAGSAMSILVYDPQRKVQLRLEGFGAARVDEAQVDSVWASVHDMSRVCYQVRATPGSTTAEPGAVLECLDPAEEARSRFGVVDFTASYLEWLYLAAQGHRRASFEWSGDNWEGRWRVP